MTLHRSPFSSLNDSASDLEAGKSSHASAAKGASVSRRQSRERRRKRERTRRGLLESLEQRQLLAGPDLVGVQPNVGSLLFESPVQNVDPDGRISVINQSPQELVFRFDDQTQLDPDTLSGIRITRAGEDKVFESATATSDLGTGGNVVLEFRARQSGTGGNGIQVNVNSADLGTRTPTVSVNGRSVQITLSNSGGRVTRVQDLILAVEANAVANDLIEVIQVTGPSLGIIGTSVTGTQSLLLEGANAPGAITDLGTGGEMRLRLISQLPGTQGQGTQISVEQRNFGGMANPAVIVNGTAIRVQVNSSPGNETTAGDFIAAINSNPDAAALVKVVLQEGSTNTLVGNRSTVYSPLTLAGASDVVIEPGFVGLGESSREVVFRFTEPLPDDLYQIDVIGTGASALANIAGEPFQDGVGLSRQFRINLGPKIVAVVPEPVRRNSSGQLIPQPGIVEVHFNDDDLSIDSAENASFYQLIRTRDTANNTDDLPVTPINPVSVDYNSITNIATLDFGNAISVLTGNSGEAVRLRVGTSDDLPSAPTEIDLTGAEAGDSLATAFDLSSQWTIGTSGTQSARLTATIDNVTPYDITLPGPDFAGTRTIRPEDPSRLDSTVPLDYVRNGADSVEGISVIEYNFPASWQRPSDSSTFTSVISEQQKERVREALQLFSEYLGINFVEVEGDPASGSAISIVVGDLAGGGAISGDGGLAVVTADTNGDGIDDLGVLDFQDFDESVDDQFGGEFFRGSMFVVGQLLGYGYADDLPQPVTQSTDFVFNPGTDNEPAFPSAADIVHGQYLYRPESTDIDFYRFSLANRGDFIAETIAERAGAPSLLDTALRLYRVSSNGAYQEVAFNDDYFSNDSLIRVEGLEAGDYAIGVSAKGNTSYDPGAPGTGFGGRSEGDYELRLEFVPQSVPTIVDNTTPLQGGPVELDGDGDGTPGGVFNFWFVPTTADTTLYVDKSAPAGGDGLVSTPFQSIRDAIDAATVGDTIRVLGNGGLDGDVATVDDNFSYKIGFTNTGSELEDGTTLDLPQGVRMIIDSGAILKLSRARVGVGSVFPVINQSDAALQVLGTPSLIGSNGLPARDDSGAIVPGNVVFTSFNDDSVGGGNTTVFTPDPRPGDWGGIDFRGDLDGADESRRNRELEGVFLNHIQYADLRYGGGAVSIGNRQVVVSPIDMAVTRPTIISSTITNSADAAIAASPDSFAETRFTDNIFQGDDPFTPDYTRVGPVIRGNTIIDNSINGLFIRVVTRTGDQLETISRAVRFDDSDITHVLAENLVIEGTPGGPLLITQAPSSLLVSSLFTDVGDVPEGTYTYRVTNVTAEGLESAASSLTTPFTLAGTSDGFGGVQLSQLPTIGSGSDFVSRRLYRAAVPAGVDPQALTAADFRLVGQLNGSSTSFVDRSATGTVPLATLGATLQSRLDGSLKIDPGTILKLDGARIEARFGADFVAEGTDGLPVVITSLEDQRYGVGGTFDTNDRGEGAALSAGDWGGIYIGQGASASIDHAVIAGGGGITRVEGGFAEFNALEVHQASLRLANSTFEQNASGNSDNSGERVGRGENASGSLFVRGSQPIIVGNQFIDGVGPALSFDVNSLSGQEVNDHGRATGRVDKLNRPGNYGPLVSGNQFDGNTINGMQVRGGELATSGVWDDTSVVHVVTDTIEIPNQHIYGGLRLQSSANASLVVKFADGDQPAAIIAGGTVQSGSGEFKDIADRIGGALQVVGTPDFPVVLTSLFDQAVGAGFDPQGNPQLVTAVSPTSADGGPAPGDWTGIVIREAAHDRNVALVNETESIGTPTINSNAIPSQSTFLGEIAPNEESGDENRRLGFVVSGKVATRDDVDVYSFIAESGTEVWLDIDQTSHSLDSVVELIDANGRVLAASNDSALGINPSGLFVNDAVNSETAQSLSLLSGSAQDDYSVNGSDAGMRVRLPGEIDTRNLYHVRVRSSNTSNPLDFATLVDPANVRGGLTEGGYQLQIRLREANEVPGTQINFADIRYATNGVQIIGQPLHSPLTGEDYEASGDNDSLANAQPLGYLGASADGSAAETGPLSSDRLAKSFAGSLDSFSDVDWYQFDITYEDITRANGESLHLSTIFDLDYADNFARADMAFYVFNQAGELILVGGDSNIADDLPPSATTNGSSDLSRGSAGSNDPYIGATELIEGTYFIAVSNQNNVPAPLDQFFNANSANPLLRLEPIDSVTRIAEDRIGSSGGGTASQPIVPVLFDDNSIVDYTLDDVVLYVNTGNSLIAVNPLTGEQLGTIGDFSDNLSEVAFRSNGELFAYSDFVGGDVRSDANWFYYRVNSGDASLSAPLSVGGGITTFGAIRAADGTLTIAGGNVGLDVEATTIAAFGTNERGYFVANRSSDADTNAAGLDYATNVLYSFDPNTGLAGGTNRIFNLFLDGDGTDRQEVGQINTVAPATAASTFLGISGATEINGNGVEVPSLVDGDQFTITDGSLRVIFEFDSGFGLTATNANPIRDGQSITIDGSVFELNTGQRIQLTAARPTGDLTAGSVVQLESPAGTLASFEFVRQGDASAGNIPIRIVDGSGQALSASAIAVLLANAINDASPGIGAQADGDDVTFLNLGQRSLVASGVGVTIQGNNDVTAGAIAIDVTETTSPEVLTTRLADAIRAAGISVASSGTSITLPSAVTVTVSADNPLVLSGGPGASGGGQPILLSAGDSPQIIAQRIIEAVEAASDAGLLNNVSVNSIASGNSLRIINGIVENVTSVNGALVAGGVPTGGTITGAELVTDSAGVTSLFAVDDNGGLYQVSQSELLQADQGVLGARIVGDYIESATDLIGLNFSGLRSGPVSYNDGELRQTLFGVTGNGDVYAFNTRGELQPIFAGGRSMISTGVAGAQGLDFSTLGYNLWHVTDVRGDDAGHGIENLDGGPDRSQRGGSSLAFNFQGAPDDAAGFAGHDANYPTTIERPGNIIRQDGESVERTYNLPGGAKGSMLSNSFSLEGYSADDQPVLYFNYFLNTEDQNSVETAADTLRVYVTMPDGQSRLVATNNTASVVGADELDVDPQVLFDNTGTWRQARVPLGEFAGMSDLSLRIDFATAGRTDTSTESLLVASGSRIAGGSQLVVNGETFTIELEPSVTVPSGVELSTLYADPAAVAVVTVDGQDYVLNDGTRTVAAGQKSVDLTAVIPAGSVLADLTGEQISLALAEALRLDAPPADAVTGLNFSDAYDNGDLMAGRNDLIFEATPLPYSGGTAVLSGTGRLANEDAVGNLIDTDDVDLLRLDVIPGTQLTADFAFDSNAAISLAVRFFDADGNALASTINADGNPELIATQGGVVFVGISGPENNSYDIRLDGSTSPAQVGTYSGSLEVAVPRVVINDAALVELRGFESVSATPANLFLIGDAVPASDLPIRISRSMSAAEVAVQVQQAIADRFTDGDLNLVPRTGASIRLPGLAIGDSGPFTNDSTRYGNQFGGGAVTGARNNNFEGAYLDDFIIGFAERGENATSSNVVNTAFVVGNDPAGTNATTTGTYQVEIRDGSEYATTSNGGVRFRTFDTNDRLSGSNSITAKSAGELRDGQSFAITDGRNQVVFEFDADGIVTPGRVPVPFSLRYSVPGSERIDPTSGLPISGTNLIRPNTASEVAESIIDAINRPDVRAVLDISAIQSSGVDAANDPRIDLFGNVIVTDTTGALAAVNTGQRRGDSNRDRGGQGVIMVENSSILFNSQFAIDINHNTTATVNGVDSDVVVRYPRNLVEQNTEGLIPGVVVRSNVLAYNTAGGLQVTGISDGGDATDNPPLPFDRIVNNTIVGGTIVAGAVADAEVFGDILFDGGSISFADVVTAYVPDAQNAPPLDIHQVADNALGAPDETAADAEPVAGEFTVSLGTGGSLTVQFTDNLLTGSDDATPDLVIFETGSVESVLVEVSSDGVNFVEVGIAGGIENRIDIDASGFGSGDRLSFVRLTDLRQGATGVDTLGADIDAVGALSTVPAEVFTTGGIAVNLDGNVAPTILNNIIANAAEGIAVNGNNANLALLSDAVVLGGNAYYRNDSDVAAGFGLGQFPLEINDSEVIFVGASDLVFSPAANSRIIDSSIDSLEDRPSLVTVKNPIGLPPSPILAPRLDVNGQLRVDDPDVETPSGLGERVFKDRGAADRGDLTGPRAVLTSPAAPGLGTGAGIVSVFGQAPDSFEIQLVDGLAPADVVPGTGIDDRTVTSSSVILLRDGEALVEGVDYRFGYNPSTNTIRLTPLAGVWQQESTYTIRMVDGRDSLIRTTPGTQYTDGGQFSLGDQNANATTFEYESGITIRVDEDLALADADGLVVTVFDGTTETLFELDTNGSTISGRVRVALPATGTADDIAAALASAINSATGFTVDSADNVVQLLGGTPLSTVTAAAELGIVQGEIGVSSGYGVQVPVDGTGVASSVVDGATFTIQRDNATAVTFEFDNNGSVADGSVAVTITDGNSLDAVADSLVRAIGGSVLGLTPINAGFGRVAFGGDVDLVMTFGSTGLTQIAQPGATAAIPIVIPVTMSDGMASQRITDLINGANLPGVSATSIANLVFVEGTTGVTGDGAVETTTIRDDVGNALQSNQTNGRTELTIFVGGGFDYGDAPLPYVSQLVLGGPRHAVNPDFRLGDTVTPDADAQLANADIDDGITAPSVVRSGFATTFGVDVFTDGQSFFLDAWFDWNGDGIFESVQRFGSAGTGRAVLAEGSNSIIVNVPSDATAGEAYARFRLSQDGSLGSTGDAGNPGDLSGRPGVGEVEDVRLLVTANPFQNPTGRFDVNDSGAVTPLDALNVINLLRRENTGSINLQPGTTLVGAAKFPDVNADGNVTAQDALLVINELNRQAAAGMSEGEGEASASILYQPVTSGVMASAATSLGDQLIADAVSTITPEATAAMASSTSVFDDPALVAMDDIVDTIAGDAASQSTENESSAFDAAIGQLGF